MSASSMCGITVMASTASRYFCALSSAKWSRSAFRLTGQANLDVRGLLRRPEPELLGRVRWEAFRLKNSGWYRRSTRVRETMTRTCSAEAWGQVLMYS